MRLWVLSDLHCEHEQYFASIGEVPEDVDVAVCAGDIARGGRWHVEVLKEKIAPRCRYGAVSVLGNHEFYRSSIEHERIEAGQAAVRSDVKVLDDMTWTIDRVRFVGATLWTDYALYSDFKSAMVAARNGLNDHRLIRLVDSSSKLFAPVHAFAMHKKSLAYLEQVLSTPFLGETVVVTHHCPNPSSVAPEFAGDKLTPAFSSDLEWLIRKYQPAAWIHGHTHASFDYMIGSTRIVYNPRGYGSENLDFQRDKVIEIGCLEPKPKPKGL